MTRSTRRHTLATALLAAALLPVGMLPALASTEVVAAPLPAPTGLAPVDDPDDFTPPHLVRKDLFLHWNPVSGATGYRVQIGRDETWSQDPTEIKTFTLSGTTLALNVGALPYATYAWRVAALKGSTLGHWTSESTNSQNRAEFTKGWRSAPTALSAMGGGTQAPLFSWTNVAEAAFYEFELSDAAFPGSVDTASPDTTPDPINQPLPRTVTCTTTRTRLAGFVVSEDPATQVGEVSCDLALTVGKRYYWHVRGVDASTGDAAERSNWSVQADFVVANPKVSGTLDADTHVDTASLSTEPDHLCTALTAQHSKCTDVPTLSWDAVPGAGLYIVTVATDDELSNVVDRVTTPWTSWTTTTSWADGSTSMAYYYDVLACTDDLAKCTPATNTPRSFRKESPRLNGLVSPANTGLAIFSWSSYAQVLAANEQPAAAASTASQDAKAYHLQVARSSHPSFDATTLNVTVDGLVPPLNGSNPDYPDTTGPTYLTTALGDGSYVWRVQAVDGSGNKLPWSLSKAFTRDTTPPRLLTVSPSYKVGVTQSLKLTFSEPVTGVSTSSLVLSPAVPYTVTVTSSTTATLSPNPRWLPGAIYAIRPLSSVKDLVGNSALGTGPNFLVNPLADDTSPAISYTLGWHVLSATNAVGGSFHNANSSSTVHPSASMTFRGTGVALTSCLGPDNGYLDVYVDGVRKARVNTYRSYSGCGVKVASVSGLVRGQHVVKILAVGAHSASSRGSYVSLDALTVTS